jgi:hypothetical protein
VRRYYLDYTTAQAEEFLARLLPGKDGRTLYGPGGSLLASFTVDHWAMAKKPIAEFGTKPGDPYLSIFVATGAITSIWADVDDKGPDDRVLVLRILRCLREWCGGDLMDEDGTVID